MSEAETYLGGKDLKIFDPGDFPAHLPRLNEVYDDLLSGGKCVRARLVQTISCYLSLPPQMVALLSQSVEFIHNATLLHDDLIDRSFLRRGKQTAWLKYGADYAVLAGDYLLARVMVNLAAHGNKPLMRFTCNTVANG